MNAIRITTHLNSETLYLPEIQPLVGKDVEIIVLTEENKETPASIPLHSFPLRGSVLEYKDPLEPVSVADWEAIR